MSLERMPASAGPTHRVARAIATAVLVLAGVTAGLAQTPPAKQPQPKQQPPAAQPVQPPAQPQQPAQAAPAQQDLQVSYTPWTKLCNPNQGGAKPICLTIKEARLPSGEFLAGAAVLEQEGEQQKLFRVTLPLGMQIGPGTRVIIDQDQPLPLAYFTCTPAGCMAQHQINPDFITKLKTGKQMTLQGINLQGQAASYPLPVGAEFAKANEGPPVDPRQFEQNPAQQQQQQQPKR